MLLQEAPISFEAVGKPLRVIEPIDSDDGVPPRRAGPQPVEGGAGSFGILPPPELLIVDPIG
jgi:hypothetical protein